MTINTQNTVRAYAALERGGPIVPWDFTARDPRPNDVVIDVHFCGICHSDLHSIGPWGRSFPLVPGHEMVGSIRYVGSEVTNFRVGQHVAVSTLVDSCGTCPPCLAENEIYCEAGATMTYDGIDRKDGTRTQGGYADTITVNQRFVFDLPDSLDPAAAAPLLCAGVTVWSPLRHWKIDSGSKVGVVGIGGLGHLGIKFAHALGAYVVAFTRSADKRDDLLALGADEVVVTTDLDDVASHAASLDFILDTVSAEYPMGPILETLKLDGVLCSLGIPNSFDFHPGLLAAKRRILTSASTGGSRDIKEMLEFAASHGIVADIELVSPDEINNALERLDKGDVRYRFVLDLTKDPAG